MNSLSIKKCIWILIGLIFLTDLAILLDIPYIRQILGFLFLTLLPGLLILQILKLNKIGNTEKVVLSVGLSISFLMFFGLLLNNLSLGLGYLRPLGTIPLLISFNVAFIVLAIIGHKVNKEPLFSLPNLNLSTSEKAFLSVPVLFPALSIFGMHLMNTTDNNIILMFLLFLIPIYVIFVCFFTHIFPKRLYPVVIFLISISLVLMFALRSNHIVGMDRHTEYYFFQTTFNNLHWSIFWHSTLDACLSISILPTIYQSILNTNQEYLCKILVPLIMSISPLIIYVLSKKYVGESYAFLAVFFFISQHTFVSNPGGRTKVAILFFALAMMVLFTDKIDPLKKRILFIVFMASCMVSHYSTTYIFFFIMLGAFVGIEILPKKYNFKKVVSLTIVILFFSMIFFWYSQVTEAAFNAGVGFIGDTFKNLHEFFILESRGGGEALLGKDILQKGIPHMIEFVFTWLTFAFIGIGVITLLVKRKEMSFSELKFKKPDFLKDKFEVAYFAIALACVGLLVVMIALPFIAVGYSMDRLYAIAITILSVFFVIGGIIVAKYLNQIIAVLRGKVLTNLSFKKKGLLKKQKEGKNALQNPLRKSVEGGKGLEVRAYLIILLVLIPYFFCVTGVMYQMFDVPRAITLNSEGKQYDIYYVHDQDSYGAKWLRDNGALENTMIYTDFIGGNRLISQAGIQRYDSHSLLEEDKKIDGYIYLRYYNVVDYKLLDRQNEEHNIAEYQDKFEGKSKVYNCGGSEVWR